MPGIKHKGGYSRSKDLTNMRFGRLVAIRKVEPFRTKDNSIHCAGWECQCDCGKHIIVRSNSLVMGKTKSCGCLNREKPSNNITHNMSNTKIYSIYKGILARCRNPNVQNYSHYGGRGITVCEEWMGKNGFENFYDWAIKNGYKEGLTIERINVDGNYCPQNCKFIPFNEQAFNKSNSYIVDGISVAKLARKRNVVPPNISRERCKRGWSLEDAVSIPIMKLGQTHKTRK